MKLQRFAGNPILSPHPGHPWEDLAVFNPAAWYDQEKGKVFLLYRTAESQPEYKCWFGLATSSDGLHFERFSDEPVLSPSTNGFDASTIQDPRIVKIDDWYYVTYAARHFIQRYQLHDCPCRFDVVAVVTAEQGPPVIRHQINAFQPGH